METTVTTKGQITLPVSLGKTLNLKTGDKIIFEETTEGHFILKPKSTHIVNLKGCMPKPQKTHHG